VGVIGAPHFGVLKVRFRHISSSVYWPNSELEHCSRHLSDSLRRMEFSEHRFGVSWGRTHQSINTTIYPLLGKECKLSIWPD
jgi:hypothetical protein